MANADTKAIRDALAKLDPKNDDHWTEQGAPLLDALGLTPKPSRQEVTAAAPLFNRANPVLDAAKPEEPAADPVDQPYDADAEADAKRMSEEDIAFLKLQLEEAQAEVDARNADVDKAKDVLLEAQRKHDALLLKLQDQRSTEKQNIEGIRQVLDASLAVREERAAIAKALRGEGITSKMLQVGSALDQAMARKRGFGQQRPNLTARG